MQNRTKGAETRSSKPAMYSKEMTTKRDFPKLRESPGVRYESVACGSQWLGMSTVEAVDRKISWLFCFISHGCTVSARSVFSMSDDVGRCIALQSVPFFASGEQGQTELCLHFRVGILEQLQKSRHGDGGFACGRYSLRAGGVGLGIEAAFKLLAQLHTGGLLDMSGARSSHSD